MQTLLKLQPFSSPLNKTNSIGFVLSGLPTEHELRIKFENGTFSRDCTILSAETGSIGSNFLRPPSNASSVEGVLNLNIPQHAENSVVSVYANIEGFIGGSWRLLDIAAFAFQIENPKAPTTADKVHVSPTFVSGEDKATIKIQTEANSHLRVYINGKQFIVRSNFEGEGTMSFRAIDILAGSEQSQSEVHKFPVTFSKPNDDHATVYEASTFVHYVPQELSVLQATNDPGNPECAILDPDPGPGLQLRPVEDFCFNGAAVGELSIFDSASNYFNSRVGFCGDLNEASPDPLQSSGVCRVYNSVDTTPLPNGSALIAYSSAYDPSVDGGDLSRELTLASRIFVAQTSTSLKYRGNPVRSGTIIKPARFYHSIKINSVSSGDELGIIFRIEGAQVFEIRDIAGDDVSAFTSQFAAKLNADDRVTSEKIEALAFEDRIDIFSEDTRFSVRAQSVTGSPDFEVLLDSRMTLELLAPLGGFEDVGDTILFLEPKLGAQSYSIAQRESPSIIRFNVPEGVNNGYGPTITQDYFCEKFVVVDQTTDNPQDVGITTINPLPYIRDAFQREVPAAFPSIASRKDYENGDIYAYCVCQAIVDNVYQLFYFGFKLGDQVDQDLEWTQLTFDGENKNARIEVDEGGNLHMVWESDRTGATQVYYGVLGPNSRAISNQVLMSAVDKEQDSNIIGSILSPGTPVGIQSGVTRLLDGIATTSGRASATSNQQFSVSGRPSENTAMFATIIDQDEEGNEFDGLEEQLSYQVSFDFNMGIVSELDEPDLFTTRTDSDIDLLWEEWKNQFTVGRNFEYLSDGNKFTIDRYEPFFEKMIPLCGSYRLSGFENSIESGGNEVTGVSHNTADPNVTDEYSTYSERVETAHPGNLRHFMLALMPEKVRFKALNAEPLFGFLERNELQESASDQYIPKIEDTYYTGRFKLALVVATSEDEATGAVSRKSFEVVRQFGDYLTFEDLTEYTNIKVAVHYSKQPLEAIENRARFDRSAVEQDYRFYGDIMVLVDNEPKLGQSFIADFSDQYRRFDVGFGLPPGSQFVTNEQVPYNGNDYDDIPVVMNYDNVAVGPHSISFGTTAVPNFFDRTTTQMRKIEIFNDILINGSFDSITEPIQPILNLRPGETAISSWTTDFVGVPADTSATAVRVWHLDPTLDAAGYIPFDGEYFIQLVGENDSNLGLIYQDVSTVAGREYTLEAVIGVDPLARVNIGSTPKRKVQISAAAVSQTFQIDQSGEDLGDPKWRVVTIRFTASSSTTRIEFRNVTDANPPFADYGPLVDRVRLYETAMIPNELTSQTVTNMLRLDESEYLINYSLNAVSGISQIPITVSTTDQNINPSLTTDPLDKVHVVWQSNRHGTWDIFYAGSRNRSIPFRFETRITDALSNSLMPSVAVDERGRRMIAWHDNRNERNYQIYTALSKKEDPQWVDQCAIDQIEEFLFNRRDRFDPYDPYFDFNVDDLGCKVVFDLDVPSSGIFHFKLEFYTDENYTQLSKTIDSRDSVLGWFVDDAPLSNEGVLIQANSLSTVSYHPSLDDNLTGRIYYVIARYFTTTGNDGDIVSNSSSIQVESIGGTLDMSVGNYESANLRVFSEGVQASTLTQSPLTEDGLLSVTIEGDGVLKGFNSGDRVHSYQFHFDPVGNGGGSVDFSITFDAPVVAVYTDSVSLAQTSSAFGIPFVTYSNSSLEMNGDEVTISADKRTISGTLAVGAGSVDDFRVIVAPLADQDDDSAFIYYCPFTQAPRCSIPYEFVANEAARDNVHFRVTFYADAELNSTILSSFSLFDSKNWLIGGGNDFPISGLTVEPDTSVSIAYDPNILPFELFNQQKGDTSPNIIASFFSSNNDNWRLEDTANGARNAPWTSDGAEGALVNTDTDPDGADADYWIAPSKFLGNLEPYYGGKFRMRYRLSTDYISGPPRSGNAVFVEGPNGTIALPVTEIPDRADTYSTLEFDISESIAGYREPGGSSFVATTEAQVRAVLRNVTHIGVPADFFTSQDEIYLSDVSLMPAADLQTVNDRPLLCGVPYYYRLESYDNEIFNVLEEGQFLCPCFYAEASIWREDTDSRNWISSGQGFDDFRVTDTDREAVNARVLAGQTGLFYVAWEDYRYTRLQANQPSLSPDYFFAVYDASEEKLYSSAQGGFDRRVTYYSEDSTGLLYDSSVFLDQFQNFNIAFHNGTNIYSRSCSVGCGFESFNPNLIQPCMFTDGTDDDFYQVGGSPERAIEQYQVMRVRKPYVSYSTYLDIETPVAVVNDCFLELDIVGVPGTYAYRLRNEDDDVWTDWLPIGAPLPEQPADDDDTRNQQNFFQAFFISRDRFIAPWIASSGDGAKRIYCEILTFFGKTESFYVDFMAAYRGLDYQVDFFFDEELTQPIPKFRNYPVASTKRTETLITDEYLTSVSEDVTDVTSIWMKITFPDIEKLQIIERLATLERFSDEGLSVSVYQQGLNDQLNIPLTLVSTGVYRASFEIAEDDSVVNVDGLAVAIVNVPGQCRPVTIDQVDTTSSPFSPISLDQSVTVFNNMTLFRDTYSEDDRRGSFGDPNYYKNAKFGGPGIDDTAGGGNADWIGGGSGRIDPGITGGP